VVNATDDPKKWWQVFDRTTGKEVAKKQWSFNAKKGTVAITGAAPGHKYTVNFLSFRLWEEISMYNHITNNWGDREHLAAVDPMQPDVQKVLLAFLDQWLRDHPDTSVVRFTSMFYNFSWFWGDNQAKLRDIYSDWGDYEMTIQPARADAFRQEVRLQAHLGGLRQRRPLQLHPQRPVAPLPRLHGVHPRLRDRVWAKCIDLRPPVRQESLCLLRRSLDRRGAQQPAICRVSASTA